MTLVVQPARRFRRLILTKAATPNHLQQRFPSPEILEAHRKEDNQCSEFRIRLIDFPFSFAQISCEAILAHFVEKGDPDESRAEGTDPSCCDRRLTHVAW
ncbi:hypothetical protein [Burkholderia ubonensis]|uniref:hypothetical protein n=1 Tax=Burkholderia ubonensis TaxID=101571 RepID=UPI000AA6C3D1|nr:hypothetical protein [Burkholderia ubonensis]